MKKGREETQRKRRYNALVAIITMVGLIIGFILWNSENQGTNKTFTTGKSEHGWSRGSSHAPIIIDVYSDYDCPMCVIKELMVMQLLDLFSETVRVRYHHYPSSEFALNVAEALEFAGDQGKFWELHDAIFQTMPGDISQLKAIAETAGLSMKTFNEMLKQRTYRERIENEKKEAALQGIHSVGLFINGKKYTKSPGTFENLKAEVELLLKEACKNGGE